MPRRLDPRFGAILSYMNGADSYIERAAARENAEEVAQACGFTYAEAVGELRQPAASRLDIEPKPEPDPADDPRTDPSYLSKRDEMIVAALAADPSRSDRSIAREARCSPTHVGKARAAAGLAQQVRVVHRGGRSYEMKIAAAPASSGEAS